MEKSTLCFGLKSECSFFAILGVTPLHVASASGKIEVVKYFQDKIKSLPLTKKGSTPLHFAAQFNQLEVVKYLMDCHEDKNPVNAHGQTPLHFAAYANQQKVAKYILGMFVCLFDILFS